LPPQPRAIATTLEVVSEHIIHKLYRFTVETPRNAAVTNPRRGQGDFFTIKGDRMSIAADVQS